MYRFLATKHSLNAIDWNNFEKDFMFQLIFPQPDMISREEVAIYEAARTKEERAKVVEAYQEDQSARRPSKIKQTLVS
ncbi:MAG: hypothetical protein U5K51_16910 [Flavobacteriaceae bacterium]|nr:hypothetical protein [Flavobacteriaceae bacterium]